VVWNSEFPPYTVIGGWGNGSVLKRSISKGRKIYKGGYKKVTKTPFLRKLKRGANIRWGTKN